MDYQDLKDYVSALDVEALIEEFNKLVGNNAWTSARAAHDIALVDALVNKGIDVSAICNNSSISFSKEIALSEDGTKIIICD